MLQGEIYCIKIGNFKISYKHMLTYENLQTIAKTISFLFFKFALKSLG
jgi:hypothetical protein